MRIELGLEILRRKNSLRNDLTAQIRHVMALEVRKNIFGIGRRRALPIDRKLAKVRHGREHVKSFTSRRRQGRIGTGRRVQIEGKIVGQPAAAKNVVQELAVARPENNIVMQ